jgi:hypothetical protein
MVSVFLDGFNARHRLDRDRGHETSTLESTSRQSNRRNRSNSHPSMIAWSHRRPPAVLSAARGLDPDSDKSAGDRVVGNDRLDGPPDYRRDLLPSILNQIYRTSPRVSNSRTCRQSAGDAPDFCTGGAKVLRAARSVKRACAVYARRSSSRPPRGRPLRRRAASRAQREEPSNCLATAAREVGLVATPLCIFANATRAVRRVPPPVPPHRPRRP